MYLNFRASLSKQMHGRSIFSILFLFAVKGEAQTLTISPKAPAPGAIVRLSLSMPASSDSISRISGTMSGEPLHFSKSTTGTWHAHGPITVDAAGEIEATAIVAKDFGNYRLAARKGDDPKTAAIQARRTTARAVSRTEVYSTSRLGDTGARRSRERNGQRDWSPSA
jgi:hypothetical protein